MHLFGADDYLTRKMETAQDMLLLGIDTAVVRANETLMDISEAEYEWDPLPAAERAADDVLEARVKRVWRVYEQGGRWTYHYAPRPAEQPAFTTIAWIMNHVTLATEMFLYCLQTGKAAGDGLTWDEMDVSAGLSAMQGRVLESLGAARQYVSGLAAADLRRLTPAPWGEMRPVYLNVWGGVIEHTIQHMMQVAVRKERIRQRY